MIDYRGKFAAVITSSCGMAEEDAMAVRRGDMLAFGRLCARKASVEAYIEDWQKDIGDAVTSGAVEPGEPDDDGVSVWDVIAYMFAVTRYNQFMNRLQRIFAGTSLYEHLGLDKFDE